MAFGEFALEKRTEYNQKLETEYQAEKARLQARVDNGENVHWQEWPHTPLYLTQEIIAKEMGFNNRITYFYLEHDRRKWQIENIRVLAKMLGLTTDELMDEYEAMSND